MVIIKEISQRAINALIKRGAAVKLLNSWNNSYAVTFQKRELLTKDFKGTEFYEAICKRERKIERKLKRARKKARRLFKRRRRQKLGRHWRSTPLRISKIYTILLFSLLNRGMQIKFNNGYYESRFLVASIERYEDKQIKKIHLKDLEHWTGTIQYSFPKIKLFKKLIRKLYRYLKKKGSHEWLITR